MFEKEFLKYIVIDTFDIIDSNKLFKYKYIEIVINFQHYIQILYSMLKYIIQFQI